MLEALVTWRLLRSDHTPAPGSGWTCPEWCGGLSISAGMMIKFILKSAASLSSMTPETRSESRCGPQAS